MKTPKESDDSPALLNQRLAQLRPVLAGAIVGDFSKKLEIPDKEDAFTELFVGVQLMTEVIREQLEELTGLNKALEAKAAEHSDALEEAQALTHLGSWQWDIPTNTISWSDEMYRIYGLKPQSKTVGFDEFLSYIHPDDVERVQGVIGTSFQTAKPFEFEHRIVLANKKQRILYGMGKVITDDEGKPVRMLGTSQDITERRIADLATRQSDERFKTVTRATNDLVYDLDIRKGSIWFNDVLVSEYGYTRKQTANTLEWWTKHIHPDDALLIENQLAQILGSKKNTWHTDYRFRKADGSYVSVRNRAFVLRDAHGQPDRMIGSLLDITHQKQLERAKDEFISLASHQLRTPLTIIRLYSEMLTGGMVGPITSDQHEHTQKITDASVRLIDLVNDMLSISRIELDRIKIEAEPTNVNQLIQTHLDELQSMAKEKGIKIHFQADKTLQPVPLDRTIFSQIIYNLLENAINYTVPPKANIEVRFTKETDGLVLAVKDNGIGIPKSAKQLIFDRFYRASNSVKVNTSGTGLGLYLVKLLTETIGGKVWFESELGKGTTFYVQLQAKGTEGRATPIIDPKTPDGTELRL